MEQFFCKLSKDHGEQDRISIHYPLVQEMVQCKAHRRGQGEGIVTYVEPHSRSNAVSRRLLDEHRIHKAHGTQDMLVSRNRVRRGKASEEGDGVVTYSEPTELKL